VHSHILQGFRESEEITYLLLCDADGSSLQGRECSNFQDKARPTWEQMEELAIETQPTPTLKPAGFRSGDGAKSEVAVADSDTS